VSGLGWAGVGAVVAAVVAVVAALAAARRMLLVVTVQGESMEPGLRDGDRVLVLRRSADRLRPGDVVVLRGPFERDTPTEPPSGGPARNVIKRLAAVAGQPLPTGVPPAGADGRVTDGRVTDGRVPGGRVPHGSLVVLGDNPERSSDSRDFGPVPAARAVGTVLHRFRPAD
jgi:signal peptidase I